MIGARGSRFHEKTARSVSPAFAEIAVLRQSDSDRAHFWRTTRLARSRSCPMRTTEGAFESKTTNPMHPLYRAIFVAAITFGASLLGMALQWVVPADVLTASKGSVGAMVGLVTLLLALVLGLLVFTAFSVFTTQRDEA